MTKSFSLKKTTYSEPILSKDQSIEDKSAVKLLGVHFDTHLKFNTHVNEVLLKSKPAFHALIRLKRAGLDSDCLSSFYQARIVSIIIYAAASWYPITSKNDKTNLVRYHSPSSSINFLTLTAMRIASVSAYLYIRYHENDKIEFLN